MIGSSRRPRLLLCLLSVGGAIPDVHAAGLPDPHYVAMQVNEAPRAIRLPIVDATDNRFLRLSTAEGVSQTKVDSIVQDDAGFVWFGTHFGLYRYDGYAFKVFARDPGNPNSLDCIDVQALFKDRNGVLWVGCDQSFNKFDRTTETFRRYPIRLATHITQDAHGLLWVASRTGLYRLDPASAAIQHYSHDPQDASSISSNDLSYCAEDKAGSLWVASNSGLDEFDRRAGKVTRHIVLPHVQGSHPEEGLKLGFFEDHLGQIWIFHSSPDPLAVFDRKNNILTRYAFPDGDPTVTRVQAMLEDRNGALSALDCSSSTVSSNVLSGIPTYPPIQKVSLRISSTLCLRTEKGISGLPPGEWLPPCSLQLQRLSRSYPRCPGLPLNRL